MNFKERHASLVHGAHRTGFICPHLTFLFSPCSSSSSPPEKVDSAVDASLGGVGGSFDFLPAYKTRPNKDAVCPLYAFFSSPFFLLFGFFSAQLKPNCCHLNETTSADNVLWAKEVSNGRNDVGNPFLLMDLCPHSLSRGCSSSSSSIGRLIVAQFRTSHLILRGTEGLSVSLPRAVKGATAEEAAEY